MQEIVTPEQWKRQYSQMKNRIVKKISAIKDSLEERYAENEDWIPVIDEAVYKFQKKTVRKMILKTINVRTAVQSNRSVHFMQKLI